MKDKNKILYLVFSFVSVMEFIELKNYSFRASFFLALAKEKLAGVRSALMKI